MYKDQAIVTDQAAEPISDIDQQVSNLRRDCKILRDYIDNLENRIRPILREENEGLEKDSEVQVYMVPLAASLRDISYSIQAMQSRVTSMTYRNTFRFRVRSVSKADESDEGSGKCS